MLRRHMAASHKDVYRRWCKKNNFESMLPEDTKACQAALLEEMIQTQVGDHFSQAQPEDKPEPYTDEIFKEAAIQWLVETDQQPIQAFEHPTFKKMIAIASRATCGVKIPTRKQIRKEIIQTFKDQMKALKERLNVSF
ncbi:hypothetical protein BDZ97DRAFT_1687043 [Flammula alnicola]|nr:hypothetical protein BDZ97DRAFT_1687043 [Flammula alnicola]